MAKDGEPDSPGGPPSGISRRDAIKVVLGFAGTVGLVGGSETVTIKTAYDAGHKQGEIDGWGNGYLDGVNDTYEHLFGKPTEEKPKRDLPAPHGPSIG